MSSLTASTIATPATIPSVRSESQCRRQTKPTCSFPLELRPLGLQCQPFDKRRPITHAVEMRSASIICAAALNATCAAEQTQTVTRQSSTITVAPIQGKEKSPELDDGGSGFPPRDDGDGGGGGGGGGGGWTGKRGPLSGCCMTICPPRDYGNQMECYFLYLCWWDLLWFLNL
ncbi:unnamed protein product [Camellia sinensis]